MCPADWRAAPRGTQCNGATGIYGHSRLRELVLGGVSRTLLDGMTVPLFTAH